MRSITLRLACFCVASSTLEIRVVLRHATAPVGSQRGLRASVMAPVRVIRPLQLVPPEPAEATRVLPLAAVRLDDGLSPHEARPMTPGALEGVWHLEIGILAPLSFGAAGHFGRLCSDFRLFSLPSASFRAA